MSAIREVIYIKVHTATRWTIRHSLKLHWFADLMNVTEEREVILHVRYKCSIFKLPKNGEESTKEKKSREKRKKGKQQEGKEREKNKCMMVPSYRLRSIMFSLFNNVCFSCI